MAELTRPDGAVIHYDVAGTGEPVVALSGWRGGLLEPAVETLRADFSVITMDQRHVGRSRAPLAPFSYEVAVADQLAVLNTLSIDRTDIIATGFGCTYALRLLYDAPARVKSAVLLGPPGRDASNTMDTYYDLFRDTIRIARSDGLEGVVAAAVAEPNFINHPGGGPWAQRLHDEPEFRDTLCALGRETYIALIVDFRDGIFPWEQACFSLNDQAVQRIRTPMLVVAGDDSSHPEGVARRIATEVANSQYVAPKALPDGAIRAFLLDHARGSSR